MNDKFFDAMMAATMAADGEGFTPTTEQLAAINSGVTAEDVEQIQTNKTNISLLTNKTKSQSLAFTTGYYIPTNMNIGDIVNLTPMPDSSWEYCIADCSAGQQITITARGGSSPRAYAFIDNDNKLLLSATAGGSAINTTIVAPKTATKCIINNAINLGTGTCEIEGYDNLYYDVSKVQETNIDSIYSGTVITYSYTLSKNDFNNNDIGVYMIYICNWSTTPTISVYMAAYSGGVTTQATLQKIAGADANISLSNGVISYSGAGYISISAIR